jgi:hypothetical protein
MLLISRYIFVLRILINVLLILLITHCGSGSSSNVSGSVEFCTRNGTQYQFSKGQTVFFRVKISNGVDNTYEIWLTEKYNDNGAVNYRKLEQIGSFKPQNSNYDNTYSYTINYELASSVEYSIRVIDEDGSKGWTGNWEKDEVIYPDYECPCENPADAPFPPAPNLSTAKVANDGQNIIISFSPSGYDVANTIPTNRSNHPDQYYLYFTSHGATISNTSFDDCSSIMVKTASADKNTGDVLENLIIPIDGTKIIYNTTYDLYMKSANDCGLCDQTTKKVSQQYSGPITVKTGDGTSVENLRIYGAYKLIDEEKENNTARIFINSSYNKTEFDKEANYKGFVQSVRSDMQSWQKDKQYIDVVIKIYSYTDATPSGTIKFEISNESKDASSSRDDDFIYENIPGTTNLPSATNSLIATSNITAEDNGYGIDWYFSRVRINCTDIGGDNFDLTVTYIQIDGTEIIVNKTKYFMWKYFNVEHDIMNDDAANGITILNTDGLITLYNDINEGFKDAYVYFNIIDNISKPNIVGARPNFINSISANILDDVDLFDKARLFVNTNNGHKMIYNDPITMNNYSFNKEGWIYIATVHAPYKRDYELEVTQLNVNAIINDNLIINLATMTDITALAIGIISPFNNSEDKKWSIANYGDYKLITLNSIKYAETPYLTFPRNYKEADLITHQYDIDDACAVNIYNAIMVTQFEDPYLGGIILYDEDRINLPFYSVWPEIVIFSAAKNRILAGEYIHELGHVLGLSDNCGYKSGEDKTTSCAMTYVSNWSWELEPRISTTLLGTWSWSDGAYLCDSHNEIIKKLKIETGDIDFMVWPW